MEEISQNLPQWAYILIAVIGAFGGVGGLVAWYKGFKAEQRSDKDHLAQLYKEYIEELKQDYERLQKSVDVHSAEYLACRVENAELKLIIKQLEKGQSK